MYQSRKLRSQPAEPAKDSELRVLPFPRISDPAFESLLNELIQHLQNAAGAEESVRPNESEEQQLPLPIFPGLIPGATTESLAEEFEPVSEERNLQPSAGLSDQEFESLLNDLVQRSQDAFLAANPEAPARREEPQPPLPIPPSILPDATTESPRGESELTGEWRDVLPPPGISDQGLESRLDELAEQLRAASRTKNSASPHSSEQSQPPLPIPPSILPETTTESPRGESELSGEGRDLIMPLLTVLVVGLAIILGVLLGMHLARDRSEARALKQTESAGSLPTVSAPLSGQSVTDNIMQGNLQDRTDASQPIELQDKHQKALTHLNPPGGLTVYEKDRVIFRLPPSQVSEWEGMEHVTPTEVGH
jgi:hypothetical protein